MFSVQLPNPDSSMRLPDSEMRSNTPRYTIPLLHSPEPACIVPLRPIHGIVHGDGNPFLEASDTHLPVLSRHYNPNATFCYKSLSYSVQPMLLLTHPSKRISCDQLYCLFLCSAALLLFKHGRLNV